MRPASIPAPKLTAGASSKMNRIPWIVAYIETANHIKRIIPIRRFGFALLSTRLITMKGTAKSSKKREILEGGKDIKSRSQNRQARSQYFFAFKEWGESHRENIPRTAAKNNSRIPAPASVIACCVVMERCSVIVEYTLGQRSAALMVFKLANAAGCVAKLTNFSELISHRPVRVARRIKTAKEYAKPQAKRDLLEFMIAE